MRTAILTSLSSLLSLVALACQGGDDPRSSTLFDTREPSRDARSGWVLGDSTLLVLGASDSIPDQVFHLVTHAFVQSNGDLVVADRGSHQVRVFGPGGALRLTFGRRGGGPQEFAALLGVWPIGRDSLFTYDALARRIAIWTPDGRFARAFPLEFSSPPLQTGYAEGGTFVAVVRESEAIAAPAPGARPRDSLLVALLDVEGLFTGSLPRLLHREQYVASPSEGRRVLLTLPFDPEGLHAIGKRHFYYAWSGGSTLIRFPYDGAPPDTIVIPRERRPLTEEMYQAWIAEVLEARRVPRGERPGWRRYYEGWPRPEFLPAFDRVIEDDEGYVWIREYTLEEEAVSRWIVLRSDGSLAAELPLSSRFEPTHIGPDAVAGVLEDDLGREQVVVWSLRRGLP